MSFKNCLNHEDGKLKISATILAVCILSFLIGLFIAFSGGGLAIAIGVFILVLSLIFGIISGAISVVIYLDWIDNG